MQLCSTVPMYKGQAIIYPSMYSLNILLYNKDYKTSNIHRWLSCVDSLPKVLITLAIMYTWGKDTKRPCTFCQAWRLLRDSSCHSWEGGIASHPCVTGGTAIPSLTPLFCFFSEYCKHFFSMSCVSCIFKSTKLFLQDNGNRSPRFPFRALCVRSCG